MFSRRLKTGYFALEGLNSFATVYFFYYLYFFMQKVYGFGNQSNLMLAALNGATYAVVAWFAGRFAQRRGYFTALKVGYAIMIAALGAGLAVHSASGHILVMVFTVVGMSFTWPTLEALVSEGEPRHGLQHMVGIYNVVWAATAALGNFSGGAMLEKLGLASLFYVPILVHLTQVSLTLWLQSQVGKQPGALDSSDESRDGCASRAGAGSPERLPIGQAGSERNAAGICLVSRTDYSRPCQIDLPNGRTMDAHAETARTDLPCAPAKAERFLRMAWLANPFAYIAINTLIAVIPGVAHRLQLSTMAAGFCCSTWCFARFGAFALLWRWTDWHYRFRWLLLAYLGLVSSFGAVLLAPNLAVLVAAQLVFGAAVGLIYYSSLFYSMDRSETKGEHGGIHEAAIGLGNCAGPAVGAAALLLAPQYSQSGTVAVSALLLCGLGGLVGIWKQKSVGEPLDERRKNENQLPEVSSIRE